MDCETLSDAVTLDGGNDRILAGRYRIVKQLGTGGMGSVWLAEDTALDNKRFAIKMLPSVLVSNKRAYRQLKDEALVAMKLTHPNIVTLRAFEENEGNPFLVMDYIDGLTLDDYLAEKGKLSGDATVKLLKPIAAALDYAHSKGVAHRDVKPGNVMVAKDGTPYILDFGIAREIQETMTRVTGKLSSGTLLYMSPEQLNGDPPKPAQDIYSFAAMAYECLKGEPPFVRGAIEDQIKNKVPEPPAGCYASAAPLVAGIMAGLAKKPEERPQNCVAVFEGVVLRRGAESRSSQSCRASRPAEPAGSRVPPSIEFRRASPRDRVDVLQPGCGSSHEERRERKGFGLVAGVVAAIAAIACGVWFVCRSSKSKPSWDGSVARDCVTRTMTLPGGATMEMIYVAPGSFMMGSPESEKGRGDNEKQHRVTLTEGFWLGKYEVTQRQWESVMGNKPSWNKGDDLPVEGVSWEDCQEFIRKVNASLNCGARLPTEAEWEYACRAGTSGPYAGGSLDSMGWYWDNNGRKTHPVGQKSPNAWGFYDMHGNVWEWCDDWHGEYSSGSVTDPAGPASGGYRVLRGGSWVDYARNCRSAHRGGSDPGYRIGNFGFRLCRSAGPRGQGAEQ